MGETKKRNVIKAIKLRQGRRKKRRKSRKRIKRRKKRKRERDSSLNIIIILEE